MRVMIRTSVGAMLLILFAGCAGRASMPPSYGYGDMFAEEESTRTSALRAAPSPPPPPPPPPSPSYSPSRGAATSSDDSEVMAEMVDDVQPTSRVEAEPMEAMPASGGGRGGGLIERVRQRRAERRAQRQTDSAPAAQAPPAEADSGGEAATSPEPPETPEGQEPEPEDASRRGPMLIYEAGLQLATRDEIRDKLDEVEQLTTSIGGFVVSQDDTTIVVRVPVAQFRETLERIEALGDVLNRRVTAVDVSEQVRDLRIRLQNAEQMRDRLAELLEEAQTVADSLVIEHELERLNETIELIRGQLESLEERVAFSTITVRFQPVVEHSEVPHTLFHLPFQWLEDLGLSSLLRL